MEIVVQANLEISERYEMLCGVNRNVHAHQSTAWPSSTLRKTYRRCRHGSAEGDENVSGKSQDGFSSRLSKGKACTCCVQMPTTREEELDAKVVGEQTAPTAAEWEENVSSAEKINMLERRQEESEQPVMLEAPEYHIRSFNSTPLLLTSFNPTCSLSNRHHCSP